MPDSQNTSPTRLLEVSGLSTGYGETTIVQDIDLTVGQGETVCVVGPNGHGKTTLLRAITGLLPAREGRITFAGERIDGRSPEKITELGVIHIPQGDHLFPDLTVEENLLMGAFPRAAWKQRRSALESVFTQFPKLEDRRRQDARTLSGGERRMVAIGRGLMRKPRLLVIDEPSLGLAPVIVEAVYEIITDLAADPAISILLVEENFGHVQDVADSVAVLEMGGIVRTGTAAEVGSDPALAQTYLGALPQ